MSADDLLALCREATQILTPKARPCDDGHDWESDGGRSCPTGCEMCSQTVYRCRRCGVYDYGDDEDGPGMLDCKSACGDSMNGWQGGPMDYDCGTAAGGEHG